MNSIFHARTMKERSTLFQDRELLSSGPFDRYDALLAHCRACGAQVKTFRVRAPRWSLRTRASARALVREGENLRTLGRLGIDAVLPMAFGWRARGGEVEAFLATAFVEDAVDLEHLADLRPAVLQGLGECVGTMHRRRFVHRDLFLRNVLIPNRAPQRLILLDCRKGKLRKGLFANFSPRGFLYDLACLQLDLLARADLDAWKTFIDSYERARGVTLGAFATRSIARRRRRLARALLAKPPTRLRGRLEAFGKTREQLAERWLG
ncbi:MAG: hypothetical protein H6834_14495 [Planctomycetes bacterium]|nr:hypothetical protein [Planctomycetota bacterium]MCB9891907.1 hypothetical protein [Planctomycetota bacterium]